MGKRWVSVILLLLCALVVSGMSGFGGEEAPKRIPTPDQNFEVTVVDQADVRTKVTMFSIGGHTLFIGRKGKGQLAVPFSKAKRADFRLQDQDLEVIVELTGGENITLLADRHQECFGRTDFGNFKIKLGDVKTVTIHRQILPEAKN